MWEDTMFNADLPYREIYTLMIDDASKYFCIGENKLRQLMAAGELEFIQNGNRRLISDQAIWDYYNRAKTPAKAVGGY